MERLVSQYYQPQPVPTVQSLMYQNIGANIEISRGTSDKLTNTKLSQALSQEREKIKNENVGINSEIEREQNQFYSFMLLASYCDPKTVVTKFPNWTKIKCEKLAACQTLPVLSDKSNENGRQGARRHDRHGVRAFSRQDGNMQTWNHAN